ncbi:hypothetical protein [Pseudonocardia endophytica]|uniref:Uncharacterized protein n=1 Tax=Pseudonocardia endophytica TaxID=401976 RepID=A0A4R1HXF0_PSEEN|nr:hypothetical protein [Pseudonocardia endophytica]TCK25785.1 hypothetical protein EV378_1608 [Pseudonocardia endophytica]
MNTRARIAVGAVVAGAATVGTAGVAMAGTAYPDADGAGHVATYKSAGHGSSSSFGAISDDDGGQDRTGLLTGVSQGVGGLLGGVWDATGPLVDGLL